MEKVTIRVIWMDVYRIGSFIAHCFIARTIETINFLDGMYFIIAESDVLIKITTTIATPMSFSKHNQYYALCLLHLIFRCEIFLLNEIIGERQTSFRRRKWALNAGSHVRRLIGISNDIHTFATHTLTSPHNHLKSRNIL